jgi:hypothetical protein
MSATSSSPPPPPATFTCIHWNKEMPTAQGTIAKLLDAPDTLTQLRQCESMATFLVDKGDKATLNLDTTLVPFLIAIPGNTRKVRMVFGVGTGFGLNGISTNALESSVLCLSGEFERNVTIPTVYVLPTDTLDIQEMNIPTDVSYNAERVKTTNSVPNNKHAWFKAASLAHVTAPVAMAVPVPAFLAPDGINKDIDSVVLYERVQSTDAQLGPNTKWLLSNFLKATVVKSKVDELNVKHEDTVFHTQPTELATKWKSIRLKQLFPTLFTTAATTAPREDHTSAAGQQVSADLIAAIIRATREATTATQEPEQKEDTTQPVIDITKDDTLGLSESAFAKLLILCGTAASCPEEIPPLWTRLSEAKATKADKESEVRQQLSKTIKWKEAKVKPLSTIISMIAKRQFEGDLSLSTLASATKGLTPFAVPCMTEAEVDAYNEHEQALSTATSTTMTDVKSNKIRATAPATHAGLVKVVKRFGNLVLAAFSEDSPLFIEIDGLVSDLENFEETAQANFTKQSIASVLWILHLQSRHFAAGLMTGQQGLLAEFQHMRNGIRMKLPVLHGDVPRELYELPNNSRKQGQNDRMHSGNNNIEDRDAKRAKNATPAAEYVERPEFYHPRIKAKLDPIYEMLGHKPMIRMMCTKAGINQSQLFPNSDTKLCIKTQIQGRCFGNCKFKHVKISDAEADGALKALKKIIDNPNLLKVN